MVGTPNACDQAGMKFERDTAQDSQWFHISNTTTVTLLSYCVTLRASLSCDQLIQYPRRLRILSTFKYCNLVLLFSQHSKLTVACRRSARLLVFPVSRPESSLAGHDSVSSVAKADKTTDWPTHVEHASESTARDESRWGVATKPVPGSAGTYTNHQHLDTGAT